MNLSQIKEHILHDGKITEKELTSKIKQKMEELSGLISEEGAAHIIANELGVQLNTNIATFKVKDLTAGLRNVELAAKIIQKYDVREFNSSRGPGKVGSFLVGDETGVIRVVLWNEQADKLKTLNETDVVKLSSGYIRDNNGRLELHLNDRSGITVNPEGISITVAAKQTSDAVRKSIKDLTELDNNVELLITLVDIYDPRFFTVCSQCGKRAVESNGSAHCAEHGDVKPDVSYVMNVLGDDGTDTMRIVLWKNQTERLLGMDNAKIVRYKDFPEEFQDVKHKLLGEIIKVVGRVKKNEMFGRLEFNSQLVFLNPNPQEEMSRTTSILTGGS